VVERCVLDVGRRAPAAIVERTQHEVPAQLRDEPQEPDESLEQDAQDAVIVDGSGAGLTVAEADIVAQLDATIGWLRAEETG
jgi:hypothetical protein